MNQIFYEMIFKRKSFHIFRDVTKNISNEEINEIHEIYKTLTPLIDDIKTEIRIVKADKTTCKRGQEYCILFYSEKKDHYLQNIGYIGQQLDLYLVSKNIGTLWFGIGKVDEEKYHDLDFVIMMAIAKVDETKFRKDMFKSKRKPLEEIWFSDRFLDIGNIVRFAPSACNTQPWKVIIEKNDLYVHRYKKPGKRGIMPKDKVIYYNRIDMGIFLLFLDVCLQHHQLNYEKHLYYDIVDEEDVLYAKYRLK